MADKHELTDKKELEKIFEDESDEESELEEVLESVSPEHRRQIEKLMISSFQMRSIAESPDSVVMKKLTSEHISKYLDGAEQEMKNSYKEKFHRKIFIFLSMIIAMVFFIVIIVLLKNTPNIMEKVIYTVGGIIAGAFGGYGLGKNQRED